MKLADESADVEDRIRIIGVELAARKMDHLGGGEEELEMFATRHTLPRRPHGYALRSPCDVCSVMRTHTSAPYIGLESGRVQAGPFG